MTKEEFNKDGRHLSFWVVRRHAKQKKENKRRKPLKKNKTSSKGRNKEIPRKSKKTKDNLT